MSLKSIWCVMLCSCFARILIISICVYYCLFPSTSPSPLLFFYADYIALLHDSLLLFFLLYLSLISVAPFENAMACSKGFANWLTRKSRKPAATVAIAIQRFNHFRYIAEIFIPLYIVFILNCKRCRHPKLPSSLCFSAIANRMFAIPMMWLHRKRNNFRFGILLIRIKAMGECVGWLSRNCLYKQILSIKCAKLIVFHVVFLVACCEL